MTRSSKSRDQKSGADRAGEPKKATADEQAGQPSVVREANIEEPRRWRIPTSPPPV